MTNQIDGTPTQRSSSRPAPPRKPQKHLMTPGVPRPPSRGDSMSTAQVQKWVTSVLAFTLIEHLSGGIVVGALSVPKESSRIGLLVIAGILGLIAVGAFRFIHQWRTLSPWLLLGLLPAGVGVYLGFWA